MIHLYCRPPAPRDIPPHRRSSPSSPPPAAAPAPPPAPPPSHCCSGAAVAPLFTPYTLPGGLQLHHRIVYAPLTRCRAFNSVPQPNAAVYYAQRATKGGLMISEGTVVGERGFGYPCTPGIFTDEQVEAWKPITRAVKDVGATFFCQIWHVGRASHPREAPPVCCVLSIDGRPGNLNLAPPPLQPAPLKLTLALPACPPHLPPPQTTNPTRTCPSPAAASPSPTATNASR